MKEETRLEGPWEFGIRPIERNSKKDHAKIVELASLGKLEEIKEMAPDVYLARYH